MSKGAARKSNAKRSKVRATPAKRISKKKSSTESTKIKKAKSAPISGKTSNRKQKSSSSNADWENLSYNYGFGNHFESEAEKGALPVG